MIGRARSNSRRQSSDVTVTNSRPSSDQEIEEAEARVGPAEKFQANRTLVSESG